MERTRQAQTKRVVSPTDETREEGITNLLSVCFFLGEALNQTLGRFCTVCGAVLVEERSKFPYYKQYDISTQQFNGELFGKRLKLTFLAFDRLALWLNLI